MMHPNPFDDGAESSIPMFGRNGTALSPEERTAIAKRKGFCLKCMGTKTHQVKLMGRTALTNENVYHGVCIRCNNSAVPANVLADWQARNPTASHQGIGAAARFRTAAHVVRYAAHARGEPGPGVRRPAPASPPIITAAVTPVSGTNRNSTAPRDIHRVSNFHRSQSTPEDSRSARPTRMADHRGQSEMTMGSLDPAIQTLQTSAPQLSLQSRSQQLQREVEDYQTKDGGADSLSLLNEIRENRGKLDVVRSALHGLRNISDGREGVTAEFKEILVQHPDDSHVSMLAIGALWSNSALSKERKREVLESGCLDVLMRSLRSEVTSDDPDEVLWALGAICSLGELDEIRAVIVDGGGIEAIVDLLVKNQDNTASFEWCCRALFMLATQEDGDVVTCDTRSASLFLDANGIRHVVAVAKQHSSESTSLWWAFRFLVLLQSSRDIGENVVTILANEDIVSVCIMIMKQPSTNADLFILTCEMMIRLLCFGASSRQHDTFDCIPPVMKWMGEKTSNQRLQECSARLLACIALESSTAIHQISEGRILRGLLNDMVNAPDDQGLQKAGMDLLWVLSSDEASFDLSLISQAKKAMEIASTADNEDGDLHAAICGCIANFCSFGASQLDTLPVDIVLRLLEDNVEGKRLSQQKGRALSAMCRKFPEIADRLVESADCRGLVNSLPDPSTDVQATCGILSAFADNSLSACETIIDAGGLPAISSALIVATSESLATKLLTLLSTVVASGAKVIQLPSDLVQAIIQVARSSTGATTAACTAIRNSMLVAVPGFDSVNTDGLADMLCNVVDSELPEPTVLEACWAMWAYSGKPNLLSSVNASQLFRSLIGLLSRRKDQISEGRGATLLAASGALACLMHAIVETPFHISDNDIDLIISILDNVIERDVKNIVLMESLLDVILILCFLAKETLIQFGVIVVVIDCMVEHEGKEMIQQKGCAILAHLASTENLQVNLSIAETDGIDMIVSALAGFTENVVIQTDACRALSHLSIDQESRMLISSQGGLILLVNSMLKHKDEIDLLEAACSALLNLSSDAEEQILANSNVIETTITLMRHQKSPSLQEKMLGVLQNISMRSKDSKRSIADAGGIAAVALSMKEFMGSPTVLERGFTTLWSLAVLEENQSLIANQDGIVLVINGMMANIANEKVQKQACGCLCTLSSDSQNKTIIRDVGGVDAIVYAMWAHYGSDALLVEACRALSSLAVNVHTNEVMIASEGEISAIKSAMRRFPDSEKLQEHACVALRNFLLSVDNVATVRGQASELHQLMSAASSRFPDRCAERARQVLASLQ